MTDVYLEVGKKKVFACALDWPGWCRSGKTEHDALAALDEYAERYAAVAKRARIAYKPGVLTVVEKVTGGATTDFGAPENPARADHGAVDAAEAKRLAKLVSAAWAELDATAAASPAELLKGPRGGGRDRDKMLGHVTEAEGAYARKIGVRRKPEPYPDTQMREAILAVLSLPSDGEPLGERGWLHRYAARRIAWHALDHAWEMRDKDPRS